MQGESTYAGRTPAEYVRLFRRRGWIVAVCLVLLPAAAVFFSERQTKEYQAAAEIYVNRDNLASAVTGIQDASAFVDPQRASETLANLAEIPAVARQTLRAVGLTDRTASFVLAQTSVVPKGNSDVFVVSVVDTQPALAVRLANAYARQVVRYRSGLDTQSIGRARDEAARKLTALEADGKQRSALYRALEEKDQELATLEALQTSRLSVVKSATRAYRVAPRPKRAAAIGLFLGLLLGIGLVFAVEAFDTRIRSGTEIAERLDLSLLSRIPAPPRKLTKSDDLVMLAHPTGPQAEAFRILRTNLEFALLAVEARSILVTSAVTQEGKSTTAANLAVALARSGRSIALVDLDLRRPYLNRFFRLPSTPGVTDVALGKTSLQESLARIDLATGMRAEGASATAQIPGLGDGVLDVLTAGPLPPDPGEFVGTDRLFEIMNTLRQSYDLVIIDSPPMLRVGDAMTLSTKVDALLVVSRLNVVRRPALTELRRLLESAPTAKLGFVLTGADGERSDRFGYGYGYGYEYGYDAEREDSASAAQEVAERR